MALDVETLPPAYLLTWEDWLKLPEDKCHYEIIGGELYMSAFPTTRHERVSVKLMFLIESFLQRTGAGELLGSNTGVRLSPRDIVGPDLLVVTAARAALVGEEVVEGAPDLVVEILSPGTAKRDLGIKRELYERSGVGEYWIVDSIGERVDVYVLLEGALRFQGSFRRNEILRSVILPGLEIPLDEMFPKR